MDWSYMVALHFSFSVSSPPCWCCCLHLLVKHRNLPGRSLIGSCDFPGCSGRSRRIWNSSEKKKREKKSWVIQLCQDSGRLLFYSGVYRPCCLLSISCFTFIPSSLRGNISGIFQYGAGVRPWSIINWNPFIYLKSLLSLPLVKSGKVCTSEWSKKGIIMHSRKNEKQEWDQMCLRS